MTQEQMVEVMIQHYKDKGKIIGPREFITRFRDAQPEDIVGAILQFDSYLDTHREEKTC